MDNNITAIAIENSSRLAHLSTIFCKANGIKVTEELAEAFATATVVAINEWYNDNKGRNFDPMTELVDNDAVMCAFEHMQGLLALASIASMAGITPADLGLDK